MEVEATLIEAPVEKAEGTSLTASRAIEDPWAEAGELADILQPPYEPAQLVELLEKSDTLRQCVDAMKVNVDGFGYMLEPLFDEAEKPAGADEEKARIEAFFNFCHPEQSFAQIRKNMRVDYEILGYGFWEIIRNMRGDVAGLNHIPGWTMRLAKQDREPTEVTSRVLDPATHEFQEITWKKRFRRFAQVIGGKIIWFKELGDPRELDADTGRYATEGRAKTPATEILYFSQYHPMTPYGVPRWIGTLLAIAGSRAAAEVNYSYFDNKGMPPFIVMVSGGRLSDKSVERIRRFIRGTKGRENFHSALVLESEGAGVSDPLAPGEQRPKIEIRDMMGSLLKDAQFMQYDAANSEKVRSTFRLPPLYVGLAKDFNRATAEEAAELAEGQVFGPEREDFDFIINRRLFPLLGVRFWRFKSKGQTTGDPSVLADILDKMGRNGLTVREARRVMEQILHYDLIEPENADWLDLPIAVYLEKLKAGLISGQPLEATVAKLMEIRKALVQGEKPGFTAGQ